VPRPRAERQDLIDALRGYLATVDGERAYEDRWTANAVRDTPGQRAAAAAARADGNTGQALRRSRRGHLPPGEQEIVQAAEGLLRLLQRSATPDADTPGRRAAERGGGTSGSIAGDIRSLLVS
jgi:hypothetical protein